MTGLFFLIVLVTFVHIGEGTEEPIPESKIINGKVSGIRDNLFFAYITFLNNAPKCGGAIIKENLILTAAHCLLPKRKALQVYVGIRYTRQLIDAKPYRGKTNIPHPNYNKDLEDLYDIGLILLKENILLGDKVVVINMATIPPPMGAEVKAIGFGKVQCDYRDYECQNENSNRLRFAFVRVIKIKDNGVIYTEGDDQNTCYGDSGGPIVYNDEIIAVVSSGQNANCTGYDIQAPVVPHHSWIQKYMQT